jgi:hypothetical protein
MNGAVVVAMLFLGVVSYDPLGNNNNNNNNEPASASTDMPRRQPVTQPGQPTLPSIPEGEETTGDSDCSSTSDSDCSSSDGLESVDASMDVESWLGGFYVPGTDWSVGEWADHFGQYDMHAWALWCSGACGYTALSWLNYFRDNRWNPEEWARWWLGIN